MADKKWLVLRVKAPSAQHAALLAEGLFAFGAEALHEKPDEVVTWLSPPAQAESYVERVRAGLAELVGQRVELSWDWEPDQDWSEEWKRGLAPRRVGQRLIIAPTWTRPDANPDDIVITIDPQMAFGTGEHASTRGMLRLIEQHIRAGDRVIDVGSGSAILSIAAARLGAGSVLAVEVDADSNINAAENIERNGARVQLDTALVDPDYLRRTGPFDLILANILSGVIIPLLPAFHAALNPGGRLLVAGILQTEAGRVSDAARAQHFTVAQEDREEEWWSALLLPV